MREVVRHARHQGPVVRALGRIIGTAVRQRLGNAPTGPGAGVELTDVVPARPQQLLEDYVRWAGGEPDWYAGTVPAHLFPQWGFPLMLQTSTGLEYPVARVLNAGCRIELHEPIPAGEPLYLVACLEDVDEAPRRVVITQRLETRSAGGKTLMTAWVNGLIPLPGGGGGEKPRKEKPTVPDGARELARWSLPIQSGFEFACLTGDFNPVHWVWPYAKVFGFKSVILHGFATFARAVEGLNRHLFEGEPQRLATAEVRFTRPLNLPREVGLYVEEDAVFVGDRPGGTAYLQGTFTTRDDHD